MLKPLSERSVPEVLLSTPAAIFYSAFAEELHRASGSPSGWSSVFAAVAALLVNSCIAFWIVADAQQSGRAVPYDFASFIFFMPPFALIYLFTRYGVRGFVPLGWYFLLSLAAVAFAWLPNAIKYVLIHR